MGRKIILLSLIATVLCPVAAKADPCTAATCDVITITQVGNPTNVFTFTVPDAPTPYSDDTTPDDLSFVLVDVPVTGPGYASLDTISFYGSTAIPSGGLWDNYGLTNTGEYGSGDPDDFGFYVEGTVLFDGSVETPTFEAGTSGSLDNVYYGGPEMYDYTITAYTAPTPEPSSLLLLGTGLTGLISAYRRRKSV